MGQVQQRSNYAISNLLPEVEAVDDMAKADPIEAEDPDKRNGKTEAGETEVGETGGIVIGILKLFYSEHSDESRGNAEK